METYFKIKSFIEFVLPVFLCGFVIIGSAIYATIESIKEEKIKKYMLDNGYEYYLRNVASFGGKCWWAYRKDNISIDEEKLYKMSFKQVKKSFR